MPLRLCAFAFNNVRNMFELSVALKYLTPRWRQLSVSIITTISILVIALVVWLVIVFFSVTQGLEKSWIQKLIALTAPIRITPTDAYYHSYYYQVDGISAASNYTLKTIGEKLQATTSDPYDTDSDSELPSQWSTPDKNKDGSLKDFAKQAFHAIHAIPIAGITAHDFEMAASNLRLRLLRTGSHHNVSQSFLNQATYLGSFDNGNATLENSLLPIIARDIENLLQATALTADLGEENNSEKPIQAHPKDFQSKVEILFQNVRIASLLTPEGGWTIPKRLLPTSGIVQVIALLQGNHIAKVIVPTSVAEIEQMKQEIEVQGFVAQIAELNMETRQLSFNIDGKLVSQPLIFPITLKGNLQIPAFLVESSVKNAKEPADLRFSIKLPLQGINLEGEIPFRGLNLGNFEILKTSGNSFPLWVHQEGSLLILPSDPILGEGVVVPKSFRDAGTLLGDQGYLTYYSPTLSAVQEQRLPIYVAGFYDPGIISIGGKLVLANKSVTSVISAAQDHGNSLMSNGINVRFNQLDQADSIKALIQEAFEREGIAPYWHIETYREFEFTKDLIQQLGSEKNLWSLLATVIIIVACSNIISMLIILVNDKKQEIGILRSMGATSTSIGIIFGICGMVMGMVGSLLGTVAAIITLKNLQTLVTWIGNLQGHEMFNPVFYGNTLPNEISTEALLFVIIATTVTSLIAGIVPAIKASMLKPSAILRSE